MWEWQLFKNSAVVLGKNQLVNSCFNNVFIMLSNTILFKQITLKTLLNGQVTEVLEGN